MAGTRAPHFHDVFRFVIQSTAQMSSAQKGFSLSPSVKLSSPPVEWIHCVSPMDSSQSETFWLVVCVLSPICLSRPESELHESRNLFYFAITRPPQLSCSVFIPLGWTCKSQCKRSPYVKFKNKIKKKLTLKKKKKKGLLRSLRGTGCFLSKRTLTFGATGLHIWVLKKFSLPGGSDGKEYACNAGDPGPIPGLRRSPGGGHGNPLQYSCLDNPHAQKSLVGYSPWGHKESDMTEWLTHTFA